MKKVLKIAMVILILASIYLITYSTYATNTNMDIWNTGKNFLDIGSSGDNIDFKGVNDTVKNLTDFLFGIGLLVVFASTIILGIKYMLVNPNEKSRIKEATTPYIIGVVIIFGAVTIWKLFIDVLDGSLL